MRNIEKADFLQTLESTRRDFQKGYYAMYSSIFGGIVTDPVLMLIPVDDHLVHRGDGVFETLKCMDGSIYNMKAHFDRLSTAITRLDYHVKFSLVELGGFAAGTIRAGGHRDCLVRVLLSRGPGGLGVNPYECPQAHVHVIASSLPPSFMKAHPGGARVATSSIPAKHSFFAVIKACNYLPNVLMKKEAVDKAVDFVAGFDEHGYLAEGATENFGIVTHDKRLLFPKADHILPGTTMLRAAKLAEMLVKGGVLKEIGFTDISARDVTGAAEVLILGTTPDVTAVIEFDGRKVGDGTPGPVQQALYALLDHDMRANPAMLTRVL